MVNSRTLCVFNYKAVREPASVRKYIAYLFKQKRSQVHLHTPVYWQWEDLLCSSLDKSISYVRR